MAATVQAIRDNDRMRIHLNGEPIALPAASTVALLLLDQGLAERRVAVEVNGAIVPRSTHATRQLQEDDRVEIVHALGGG
jgi:sulfur carrier protein